MTEALRINDFSIGTLIQGPWDSLSSENLLNIDGGAWSWSKCGDWTGSASIATASACAAGLGVAGMVSAGPLGAVAGVIVGGAGGFVVGAAIGFVAYSCFGWW